MKHSVPHSCNVLHLDAGARRLWQFTADGGQVKLSAEESGSSAKPLPTQLVGKGWQSLWQRKLNIAWLPGDQVFLRVVQLPKCDFTELLSMVEFQLEKLSPLPVAQIVWSVEVIPTHGIVPTDLQTVLVVVIARNLVEAFLGQLESQGYLADRLELSFLHQLLATRIDGDGAWIYPRVLGDKTDCLVAWWYGGVLQNLSLANLTVRETWGQDLGAQLTKIAWAGELEGWLTSPPRWHLVADEATAAIWQPLLNARADQSVEVTPTLELPALAAASARRVARTETTVNLLPPEFGARYQQQLVDRIWMRGLGGVAVVYIMGVLIYFAMLQVLQFQKHGLEQKVVELSGSYTNAMKTRELIKVMQEQVNLKYAVLDTWKAVSEQLPDGLTLTDFSFSRGKTVTLRGTGPVGNVGVSKVTDFNEALGKVMVKNEPLFSTINPPAVSSAGNAPVMNWNFAGELKRAEVE